MRASRLVIPIAIIASAFVVVACAVLWRPGWFISVLSPRQVVLLAGVSTRLRLDDVPVARMSELSAAAVAASSEEGIAGRGALRLMRLLPISGDLPRDRLLALTSHPDRVRRRIARELWPLGEDAGLRWLKRAAQTAAVREPALVDAVNVLAFAGCGHNSAVPSRHQAFVATTLDRILSRFEDGIAMGDAARWLSLYVIADQAQLMMEVVATSPASPIEQRVRERADRAKRCLLKQMDAPAAVVDPIVVTIRALSLARAGSTRTSSVAGFSDNVDARLLGWLLSVQRAGVLSAAERAEVAACRPESLIGSWAHAELVAILRLAPGWADLCDEQVASFDDRLDGSWPGDDPWAETVVGVLRVASLLRAKSSSPAPSVFQVQLVP